MLIGAVSGGIVIIAIISGICGYKLRNKKTGSESTQQPTGGNTFVHNDIQFNSNPKTKFGSFKRKRNNRLEELPLQPPKLKELEGVLTLGEQLALEAKESA